MEKQLIKLIKKFSRVLLPKGKVHSSKKKYKRNESKKESRERIKEFNDGYKP